MLLQVVGSLRGLDLEAFQSWVPFMQKAHWLSGGLGHDGSKVVDMEFVETIVLDLVGQLAVMGLAAPDRALVFVLADWGQMELDSIERILGLLGNRLPKSRIEAMLFTSREGRALDLILVAG
jgi:hypothetical protein